MSQNMLSNSIITKGFWLAGAFNIIGVLAFSKFFTNTILSSLYPAVFSWAGLVAIILWGFAYVSVATSYQFVPYLLVVFYVEKMFYTYTWLTWLTKNGDMLSSLYSESWSTALFFSIYGAGDFIFGLFFLLVAIKCLAKHNPD